MKHFAPCASLCLALLLAAPAHAAGKVADPHQHHDDHAQHSMTKPMQDSKQTIHEGEPLANAIELKQAFARPTYGQTKVGAGFVSIKNLQANGDVLLSASSPIAANTELHTNKTDGDIMRMQKVNEIAIAAGETVKLAPGGMHLMFFRLTEPLKEGMHFTVRLVFAKAGPQEVEFVVKQK